MNYFSSAKEAVMADVSKAGKTRPDSTKKQEVKAKEKGEATIQRSQNCP